MSRSQQRTLKWRPPLKDLVAAIVNVNPGCSVNDISRHSAFRLTSKRSINLVLETLLRSGSISRKHCSCGQGYIYNTK